jgi:hypothetical protein
VAQVPAAGGTLPVLAHDGEVDVVLDANRD